MKIIKKVLLSLGVILSLNLVAVPMSVNALDVFGGCDGVVNSSICKASDNNNEFANYIKTISNTALYALGAVAVITIIISGVRYTTSHGDPKAIQVAKDTLLYTVIGVVVALSAYAIVNFIAYNIGK